MLSFPNCKINLGLQVVEKRPDGFHNIETVFYPIKWREALEVIESKNVREPIVFTQSGNPVQGYFKDNIIYKAWHLVSILKNIPPIKVHLHKNIPMGAGLGGGSSDAAFFINLLDSMFNLNIPLTQKFEMASQIGSDCAFFIENKPVLATGKGNVFADINVSLKDYYFLLVYPKIHCNTKEGYQDLIPAKPMHDLRSIIETRPVGEWKDFLTNDFEKSVFNKYPEIKMLKQLLYDSGAVYASMSGSGSTVFGLFASKPNVQLNRSFDYFLQNPSSKVSYC